MVRANDARRLALALPEAIEQDHHGFPSFRVRTKIFATLPDSSRLNVLLGPEEAGVALAEDPEACEELWWGKQIAGIVVHLPVADAALVDDLLRRAWRRRAPKSLHDQLDDEG